MDLMIRGGRDFEKGKTIRKDSGIVFKNEGAFELSLPLSSGWLESIVASQSTPETRELRTE
jgi:hypothetical protein